MAVPIWVPLQSAASARTADVYIATDGSDSNAGTRAAPVATIAKARQLIAALIATNANRSYKVLFCGGTYYLTAKEIFTLAETVSVGRLTTWAAYPGETVALSGGKALTGFAVQGNGTWTLNLSTAYAALWSAGWRFGQIWVNGQRAKWPIRPVPGGDWFHVAAEVASSGTAANDAIKPRNFGDASGIVTKSTAVPPENTDRFGFNAGELNPAWTNPTDIRVRIANPQAHDSLLPVEAIDGTGHICTMNSHTLANTCPVGTAWRRENVYEDLGTSGQTGEMYLNSVTGVLTYVPRVGETPANSTVIAPVLDEMILVSNASTLGTPGSLVGRMAFKGLAFRHTNSPVLRSGYIGGFLNKFCEPVAALTVIGGTAVSLENVVLENIGEAGAIFGPGSSGCAVRNSTLRDLGASPIIFGQEQRSNIVRYPDNFSNGPSTDQWAIGAATVHNSVVIDFGHVVTNSCVAIGRGNSNCRVTHNDFSIAPAWAFHLGMDPGVSLDPDYPSSNNYVGWNHAHDLGYAGATKSNDWGAFYITGTQLGTLIEFNKIHDIFAPAHPVYYGSGGLNSHGGDVMGIYCDDRSNGLTVRFNLINNVGSHFLSMKGQGHQVYNNVMFGAFNGKSFGTGVGYSALQFFTENIPAPFANFYNNLLVWDDGTADGSMIDAYAGGALPGLLLTAAKNLYFKRGGAVTGWSADYSTISAWQAHGKDADSLFNTDPLFADPDNGDFTLPANSPALALGFTSFDLSAAGRL